ncbi:MAG: enoyl-CoA hydratase/isomerase family protein [Chloroflexi bacterium]|nr:enoyl-CoA hydratase/isomerase family protein [Chloroflexota bacterium]
MPLTGPDIILYEKRENYCVITLNRPERLNAISVETGERMYEIESDFANDPNMRVAIYTGAGDRSFSAGMDLIDFAERAARGEQRRGAARPPIVHWKPTIAAVNGLAYGGGCERALSCDIRIAADHVKFALPEVKRGLIPGSGVYTMPRTIGPGIAMWMCLTGEPIDAQEAWRIGLVTKVVPKEQLMEAAIETAQIIAANGPLGVQAAKQIVKQGMEVPIEYAMAIGRPLMDVVFNSEDAKEGATAFREKRTPTWKGR